MHVPIDATSFPCYIICTNLYKSLWGNSFEVGEGGKDTEHRWQLWPDNGLATKDRKHLEKIDMGIESYAPPVDKLLTYGDGR